MNDKNLKGHGFDEISPSEQREIAKKGGQKSGEVRRRKRDMKNAVKMLLGMKVDVKQKSMRAVMKSLGISEEDTDYQMAILAAQLLKAGAGDTRAAEFLRDTAGESPTTKAKEADLRQRKAEFKYQKEKEGALDEDGDDSQVEIYLPEKDNDGGDENAESN